MNFTKISRRALIAFGLVASATGAMAQSSATATGTATANVIRPITIVGVASTWLSATSFPARPSARCVIAGTAGRCAVSSRGGVTQPGSQKGTVTSAQFDRRW